MNKKIFRSNATKLVNLIGFYFAAKLGWVALTAEIGTTLAVFFAANALLGAAFHLRLWSKCNKAITSERARLALLAEVTRQETA